MKFAVELLTDKLYIVEKKQCLSKLYKIIKYKTFLNFSS